MIKNDLLSLAADVEENGFSDFEKIPDGLYECSINFICEKDKAETGSRWVSIQCEILDGEHVGSFIFVSYFLEGQKIKPFQIRKSVHAIRELAAMFDYTLPASEFTSVENVVENLKILEGKIVNVTKTTTTNNGNDYENFKIEKGSFD